MCVFTMYLLYIIVYRRLSTNTMSCVVILCLFLFLFLLYLLPLLALLPTCLARRPYCFVSIGPCLRVRVVLGVHFLFSAIRSNRVLNLFGVSLVQGVVFLTMNVYVGLSCSGMYNIWYFSKISLFPWYLTWVYSGLVFQEKKLTRQRQLESILHKLQEKCKIKTSRTI